ncbi:biotin--[acetyl-CoA-carboxylase] ligase [Bacillaceae bacterium W0354]
MGDTRQKLIELLSSNKGTYTSGQELSNQLNITRSAIWKHMNELKKEGYIIEGVTNKGYRILSTPTQLSKRAIQWGLDTKWLGRQIEFYEQVDSTQIVGHELAQKDYPHGTVVMANEQTNGRGRLRRPWESKSGYGLWFSVILRPTQLEPKQAPQLTLVAAVALAKFLEELGLDVKIKWPNDIFINGKKLAGILTEMQAEQDTIQYILLGIGLNVRHDIHDFHEIVKNKATSLYLQTKVIHNMNKLYKDLFVHLENMYEIYLNKGFQSIKELWETNAYKINEWVDVQTNKTWKAQIIGIHEDGALVVQDENQKKHILYSAEILW